MNASALESAAAQIRSDRSDACRGIGEHGLAWVWSHVDSNPNVGSMYVIVALDAATGSLKTQNRRWCEGLGIDALARLDSVTEQQRELLNRGAR